jgi:hypothetical protein
MRFFGGWLDLLAAIAVIRIGLSLESPDVVKLPGRGD